MKKHLILPFLFLASCASYEVTPSGRTQKTVDAYMDTVEKYSDKARKYSGFYNTIDLEGTFINKSVSDAQVEQAAYLYQWDATRASEEAAKRQAKMATETEFFVSFYTPERRHDTLFKSDSIWKIFLDVDGRRYEGTAKKIKMELIAIEGLYPYHNRFYTPYSVTFPVATSQVEGRPAVLTVTGAVGSASLKFNP